LTVFIVREMRIASGAEEMLAHVAIPSEVIMVFRLHLPLGTFTTCTAPTGTLQMTTDVIKLLRLDYCLRIAIPVMSIPIPIFATVYIFIAQNARCIAIFT